MPSIARSEIALINSTLLVWHHFCVNSKFIPARLNYYMTAKMGLLAEFTPYFSAQKVMLTILRTHTCRPDAILAVAIR